MKKYFVVVGFAMALVFSAAASAREVTLNTQLTNYRGDGAYLAIYLTDSNGVYRAPFGSPVGTVSITSTCAAGPEVVAWTVPSMTV